MMMLTELTAISAAALPVQALKDHLRLGTGFGEEGLQDGLLEAYLRAAMAAIEGRIGKVLITRSFRLVLNEWRDPAEQALPVAPVSAVTAVVLRDAAQVATPVAASRYRLVTDRHRPKLAAVGYLLPDAPGDGQIEITFDAGFGATWAEVPADLAQAVLLLAAEYYENRQGSGGPGVGLPAAVQALIETWRTVRVLGGGAA